MSHFRWISAVLGKLASFLINDHHVLSLARFFTFHPAPRTAGICAHLFFSLGIFLAD
tara:strand:- start:105 stop:275 length:171 start_codon:yes stop_codon:yes gene_type:complete